MSLRQWQVAISIFGVLLAVVLQLVVVSRLPLPGAVPGLALVVVVGIGMGCGPAFGAVAGFSAGLALDVVPPATGVVGTTALALVVVGDLAGRVRDPRGLAPVQRLAVVGGLAALAAAVQLVFGLVLGVPAPSAGAMVTELLTFTATTTLLGAVVVPAVSALLRRAGGDRRVRRPRAVPG